MATLETNVRQANADFQSIKTAIVERGVVVPDGTPTSAYADKIRDIQSSGGTDTSKDTVAADKMLEGTTAHNAAGQEITGTIPNYDGAITEGAVPGAQAKYEEGVADGKQAEYDAFWDEFQLNANNSLSGRYAGCGWTAKNFRPTHDIKCTGNLLYTFYACGVEVDLVELANSLGIEISFNGITGGEYIFYHADFTRLPELDFSLATNKSLWGIFTWMDKMHTMDKLILPADGSLSFMNSFNECKKLVNLTIEGAIGKNGFDFHWSPLSKASLTSIVNALSSTTTGLTVTLRKAAVDTAFETAQGSADGSSSEEWLNLIATKSNWTINLINS